ncbi:MAG: SH3 domain-containing protein, partial [Chloroflexaceae bacterium]|nr:SH3 domain-containing protein [Chloroflexaceae bacterium]
VGSEMCIRDRLSKLDQNRLAGLAADARRAHPYNRDAALDTFFALADPEYARRRPALEFSAQALDIGPVSLASCEPFRLRVYNRSGRYVNATVSTPAWLRVDTTTFDLVPHASDQELELTFTPQLNVPVPDAPRERILFTLTPGGERFSLPIVAAIASPDGARAFARGQGAELAAWATEHPRRWAELSGWIAEGGLGRLIGHLWAAPDLGRRVESCGRAKEPLLAANTVLDEIEGEDRDLAAQRRIEVTPAGFNTNQILEQVYYVTVANRGTRFLVATVTQPQWLDLTLDAEQRARMERSTGALAGPRRLFLAPGEQARLTLTPITGLKPVPGTSLAILGPDGHTLAEVRFQSGLILPSGGDPVLQSGSGRLTAWAEANWEAAKAWLSERPKGQRLADQVELAWGDRPLAERLRRLADDGALSPDARLDAALAMIDPAGYGERPLCLASDPPALDASVLAAARRFNVSLVNRGERFVRAQVATEGWKLATSQSILSRLKASGRGEAASTRIELRPGACASFVIELAPDSPVEGALSVRSGVRELLRVATRRPLLLPDGGRLEHTEGRRLADWCTASPERWGQAIAWLFGELPDRRGRTLADELATCWCDTELAAAIRKAVAGAPGRAQALDAALAALDPDGYGKAAPQIRFPAALDLGLAATGVEHFILELANNGQRFALVSLGLPPWLAHQGQRTLNVPLPPQSRVPLNLRLQPEPARDDTPLVVSLDGHELGRIRPEAGILTPDRALSALPERASELTRWCSADPERWALAGAWLRGCLPERPGTSLADEVEARWGDQALAARLRDLAAAPVEAGDQALDEALAALDPASFGAAAPQVTITPERLDFGTLGREEVTQRITVRNAGPRLLRGYLAVPPWIEVDKALTLAPGAVGELQLRASPQAARRAPGPKQLSAQIEVRQEDGRTLATLQARGVRTTARSLIGRIVAAVTVAAVLASAIFGSSVWMRARAEHQEARYQAAVSAMAAGDHETAVAELVALGAYKDAPDLLGEARYQFAVAALEQGDWEAARATLRELGAFKDAPVLLQESYDRPARIAVEQADWPAAAQALLRARADGVLSAAMNELAARPELARAMGALRWQAGKVALAQSFEAPKGAPRLTALADGSLVSLGVESGIIVIGAPTLHERRFSVGADGAVAATGGADVELPRDTVLAALSPTGDRYALVNGSNGGVYVAVAGQLASPRQAGAHAGKVSAVAFSPDGALIATAGADQVVRLWAAELAQPAGELAAERPLTSVAFSGDGRKLAAGDTDGSISVWSLVDRALVRLDPDAAGLAGAGVLAFDPTGVFLAAGYEDGSLRVWALDGGRLIHVMRHQADPVAALAFAPDGQTLASGGADRRIYLWRLSDGQLLQSLEGHSDRVTGLAFAPDGSALLSSGSDTSVRNWAAAARDLLDPSLAVVVEQPEAGLPKQLEESYYAPIRAALSGGDPVTAARVTLELEARYPQDVELQALLADNPELARATDALRWHTGLVAAPGFITGLEGWAELSAGGGATIYTVAFDPGLPLVGAPRLLGRTLNLPPDLQPALPQPTASDRAERVLAATWRRDGTYWASAHADGSARIWRAVDGTVLRTLSGHEGRVTAVAFSAGGDQVATGGADGTVRVWNVAEGKEVARIEGFEGAVGALAWSPDGAALAGGDSTGALLLLRADGELLHSFLAHEGAVTSVRFSPDGSLIATAGIDHTIRVWDTATRRQFHQLEGHSGPVRALAFSPTGLTLASGGDDLAVRLWRVADGRLVQSLEAHTGSVRSLSFTADGRILVSSGEDKAVRFWKAPPAALVDTALGTVVASSIGLHEGMAPGGSAGSGSAPAAPETSPVSTAPEPAWRPGVVQGVAPNQLRVRAGPGADVAIIARLPEGTQVKVFDTRTAGGITWYRIGFEGGEGWASAEFITLP